MNIGNISPFTVDWEKLPFEKITGESGFVTSKTQIVGEIKIRLVEYSKNYLSDHWCNKGHIIFVLEGVLILEQKDNSTQVIKKGMSYFVGENSMAHRAKSIDGAKALIVD
jgi:hypothetical protein